MTERFDTDTDTADLRALLDGVAAGVTPQTDAAWASIEARLRDSVVALPVAAADEALDADEAVELDVPLAAVDGRAARWHRRRAVLAVAAAVIVVAGVVGVLATQGGDQRPADDRGDVFPHLTYVPDGLKDTGATLMESVTTPTSAGDALIVLESADGMRGFVVEARLAFFDAIYAPTRPIDLGNGRAARRTTTGAPTVTWIEQRLTVTVAATGLARVDDADLERVARGIRIVRDASLATTVEVGDLPDGFRVAYRGTPADRYPPVQAHVSFGRQGDLTAAVDESITGTVFLGNAGMPPVSWFGVGDELDVQGHRAVVSRDATAAPGVAQTLIAWSPAPGVTAVVVGSGVDEAELVRVADGMRFVSEATFRSEHPSVGPDSAASETPPPGVTVAEGTADGVAWRLSAAGSAGCYVLESPSGSAQVCGDGPDASRLGPVLTAGLDAGTLLVLVAEDDPATLVAEVDDSEVARGTEPQAMAGGRSERVLTLVVPGDPSSVMLRGLRSDGTEQDRTVVQLRTGAPRPQATADPDALKAAPVLTSGIIEGSTPWTLRGGDIPQVDLGPNGLEPTGASRPCVSLTLGARDGLMLCEGAGQPDSVLGATDAVSMPVPRRAVLAFVDEAIRSYRLAYEDGRTGSVDTVAVAGLTGRRAVAFVVGLDEHLVSVTPIRSNGSAGERIAVDVPGAPLTTFRLGEQGGTFEGGEETSATSAVTAP